MLPESLLIEGEVVLEGITIPPEKAAAAVERCVEAIVVIRSYQVTVADDEMQVEMKELIRELLDVLTGGSDAETDTE